MKQIIIDDAYLIQPMDDLNFSIRRKTTDKKTGERKWEYGPWRYASRVGEALRIVMEDMERTEYRNGADETIVDLHRTVEIIDGIREKVRRMEVAS